MAELNEEALMRVVNNKTKKGARTTRNVADAIENLRQALTVDYDSDFAFLVSAHGKVVAASNLIYGEIFADY